MASIAPLLERVSGHGRSARSLLSHGWVLPAFRCAGSRHAFDGSWLPLRYAADDPARHRGRGPWLNFVNSVTGPI